MINNNPYLERIQPIEIASLPARHFWNAKLLKENAPDLIVLDNRSEADPNTFLWAGDYHQTGWFLHGFHSAWMPDSLLEKDQQDLLADALFSCTRYWSISLHFNNGLYGATKDEIYITKITAM